MLKIIVRKYEPILGWLIPKSEILYGMPLLSNVTSSTTTPDVSAASLNVHEAL